MRILLLLVGLIAPFFMLRYRQKIGDMLGEAEWMNKVGGVYNLVVIVALIIFFWSIAEVTGTTDVLFRPLLFFVPGATPDSTSPVDDLSF